MTEPIDLPPELQQAADQLAEQPPAVREMFRYAIVLAMIDDEKASEFGSLIATIARRTKWLPRTGIP